MYMKQKWNVGEIRQIGKDKWVQCIEGKDCNGCYFYKSDDCPYCYYEYVSNNRRVTFKKLEKIGDPIEYNGQWFQMIKVANKTQVCGQCVFKGYCLEEKLNCKIDAVFAKIENYKPKNEKTMEEKENEKKTDLIFNTETQVQLLISNYSNNNITLKNLVSKLKELFSEENKVDCIPFDIKKARNGSDVCTRDGKNARILCFDAKGDRPIVALIDQKEISDDYPYKYYPNGSFYDNTISDIDLVIVPSIKTGYVNLYKNNSDNDNCIYNTSNVYSNIEEARNHIVDQDRYIDTVEFSWKE